MSNTLIYFYLSAIVNALTSTALGIFLLITNYKKRIARYLANFCGWVAMWSYGYLLWQISKDETAAIFWIRFLMVGAILSSVSYFHLVLIFIDLIKERFYKFVLMVFYFFSFCWAVADLTPYFVAGTAVRSYFAFWPIAGPLYFPFLIAFGIQVTYASLLLYKHYRKSSGAERMQTLLLLCGIFVAFIGGATNYPLWYNIDIPPWGNGLVTIYVILTVYAIMKYRFMDVKVIFAELFAGLIVVVSIIDAVLSRTYLEFIFRATVVFIMGGFGIILIRSVRQEIKTREDIARNEEIALLARSLEKANFRLQELDRQKTEFLTIAAHQLRTPISIINNYISMLQDGDYGEVTSEAKAVLGNMDESNKWLVRLADEFLNIANLEQGQSKYHFSGVDLAKIIDGVVAELSPKAELASLRLDWQHPGEPLLVVADEEKIRVCVFNLVDNAVKYGRAGQVEERTKETFFDIVIKALPESGGYAVRVFDNGIGFDKEDEARLFKKFCRGNNAKGINVNSGTGLGLYISKKFIEGHSGKIWARSEGPDKGSEFGFWLQGNIKV